MKYLDLDALDEVTEALNFETLDSSISGGCDVYTIKAAGRDKKLYKRIKTKLQDRYEQLEHAARQLPPHQASQFELNLARMTPFGTFHDAANRRTFTYLIATLNATHEDYDFANQLNVDDFHRVTLDWLKQTIDQTMYHLRPAAYPNGLPARATTSLGSPIWSLSSWQLIDSQVDLANCECYVWQSSDDPFIDDGAIWSHHFFMYNKDRKRVCYFYLRGVSALSNSPSGPTSLMTRFKQATYEYSDAGSRKRAEYWLGDRAKEYGEPDELDDLVIDHPGEIIDADEVEYLPYRETSMGADYSDDTDSDVEFLLEREMSKSRSMSDGGARRGSGG